MENSQLVFHKNYGRGLVVKKSPSGSLIEVRFKNYENQVVLSSTLTEIK